MGNGARTADNSYGERCGEWLYTVEEGRVVDCMEGTSVIPECWGRWWIGGWGGG